MEPMPIFNLLKPVSVAELLDMQAAAPEARVVAGGTDLVPNIRRGIERPPTVIDLNGVAEMAAIDIADDGSARIGAAVTLADLCADPQVQASWPVVVEAAETVAGPTHREVATIGGNLCLDTRCVYYNQSEWWRNANDYCLKREGTICHVAPKSDKCFAAFSGDVAPACIVVGAAVDIAGPEGQRTIPLADLYREDGAAHLTLAPGEVVVALRLDPPDGSRAAYAKVRQRGSIDFPLVGVAVAVRRDGDTLGKLGIAFTGTNSRPLPIEGLDVFAGSAMDEDALDRIERLVAKQLQPTQNPPRRFPLALRPRRQSKPPHLQDVDQTGTMCISGISETRVGDHGLLTTRTEGARWRPDR